MRSIGFSRKAAVLVTVLVASSTSGHAETDWTEARRFWAFQPPVRSTPPSVTETGWVRRDLDRFILHRLEQEGLRPAPESSPQALVRRLSLDLTGLPPSAAADRKLVKGFLPCSFLDLYYARTDKREKGARSPEDSLGIGISPEAARGGEET